MLKEDQQQEEQKKPSVDQTLILERFQIQKKLSEGGFGKVYLCKDTVTNELAVVKINSEQEINDNEFLIAEAMSGTKGFPKVYGKGMLDG
jgi:predicted Ser/Thr protein kinase